MVTNNVLRLDASLLCSTYYNCPNTTLLTKWTDTSGKGLHFTASTAVAPSIAQCVFLDIYAAAL